MGEKYKSVRPGKPAANWQDKGAREFKVTHVPVGVQNRNLSHLHASQVKVRKGGIKVK